MSKFIPFKDKIEVRPFTQKGIILDQEQSLIEAGEVVAIGSDVTFVKVGDTLYFDAWGCSKTPEQDGERHYVVPEKSEIILGKNEKFRECESCAAKPGSPILCKDCLRRRNESGE